MGDKNEIEEKSVGKRTLENASFRVHDSQPDDSGLKKFVLGDSQRKEKGTKFSTDFLQKLSEI